VKSGKQAYVQDYSIQSLREYEKPEEVSSPTLYKMSIIEERASKKLGRKYCWRIRTEETGVYSFFDLHKKERMSEENKI
jgi:hypothetical protein